jgi:aldehyde dehydrogenase
VNRRDLDLFIGGSWTAAQSRERISVANPARTSEVVGSIAAGAPADVDRAVAAAKAAQRGWAALSLGDRADRLRAAGANLASIDPAAPEALTREMGKVLAESQMDFQTPPMVWSHYLQDVPATEELFTERFSDEFGDVLIRRRPFGVVGAIVPWNWPIALLGVKLGPALLAGNTIVAVPSPNASLGVLLAVEALATALPAGVVNVVTGLGDQVGAALAGHPDVRMVAFTGGTEVGRAVARTAAGALKPTVLELGGNDAAVLLDDAVVTDALVRSLAAGFTMTSGQVCFAIKRLYVHESLFADVVGALSDVLSEAVVGDGLDPAVTMGPLANRRQFDRVRALVAEAESAGAKVQALGRQRDPGTWQDGFFELPQLITDVDPGAGIVVEEQFGPALPVLPFETDEQALELVNGTDYGLTCSIWSADSQRALRLAERAETGVATINQHGMLGFDIRAPFGGTKSSGHGREMGNEGLLEFTWSQQVNDRHPQF